MVTNETAEIYDIYGIWHVPFWQTRPFIITMWILFGLLVLAFIYGIIRLILKRKKKVQPWTWANRELDALWKQRGVTREDGKRFYFQLTEIIKIYLEKRYGYQVRSATDLELLAYLRECDFAPDLWNDLSLIFEGAQEIKFANLDAIPEEIERAFALAKAFVAKTSSNTDVV